MDYMPMGHITPIAPMGHVSFHTACKQVAGYLESGSLHSVFGAGASSHESIGTTITVVVRESHSSMIVMLG